MCCEARSEQNLEYLSNESVLDRSMKNKEKSQGLIDLVSSCMKNELYSDKMYHFGEALMFP